MSSAAFQTYLEAGDVDALTRAWAQIAPHLPQPKNRTEAEVQMHMARTSAACMPLKKAAYSHRWLTERGLPSQLPDEVRPKAERMYPTVVEGVGISIKTNNDMLKPAVIEVRKSMEDAVNEAYADGRKDPGFIRERMMEARARTWRALFGR